MNNKKYWLKGGIILAGINGALYLWAAVILPLLCGNQWGCGISEGLWTLFAAMPSILLYQQYSFSLFEWFLINLTLLFLVGAFGGWIYGKVKKL